MTVGDYLIKLSITITGCLLSLLITLVAFKNNPDNKIIRILEEKVIEKTIESCREIKEENNNE